MSSLRPAVAAGAAAGAAGTTALHAATYLDMVLRGRPASATPERSVERIAATLHVPVPGAGERRESRLSGLGALAGITTGVLAGSAYGAVRGLGWRPRPLVGGLATAAGTMLAANGPMVVLGVTDPRAWTVSDWLADVLPHLAFGLVTAAAYDAAGP